MASIICRVHYATKWGENLLIELRSPSDDSEAGRHILPMRHEGEGFWSVPLNDLAVGSVLEYRYEFQGPDGERRREPAFRRVEVVGDGQYVWDHFFAPELADGAFLRQAFAGIIFNPAREKAQESLPSGTRVLRFTLRAPRVSKGQRICILGGHVRLGSWDPSKARVMSGANYPCWELDLPAHEFGGALEFKFGVWDERAHKPITFEHGPNRRFYGVPSGDMPLRVNFEHYQHPTRWRGAGVAIPVFSLRTERGYGIGEFADLTALAEWAASCDLHMVQVLPINDTSSDFSWKDSYPYKAISTAALHPIYLNVEKVFEYYGVPIPQQYPQDARR
jgi:4-alpha-glucanotransferase